MAILYPNPGAAHGQVLSGEALEALEAYKLVEGIGDGFQLPAVAGNICAGVTIAAAAIGEQVAVVRSGRALVELGATLSADALVMGATDGQAVAATTALYAQGRLITGGDAGDLATIELFDGPHPTPA